MVHNLRMINWENPMAVYDWAGEMDAKFKELILSGNYQGLINYPSLGKAAALSIPTPEHFLPMLYVLGLLRESGFSKRKENKITFFNEKTVLGSVSMTSFKIL